MFSLIIVVVAIGLMAAIIATTINYVPMDAQQRQAMFKEADRGIKALDCAVTRFMNDWRYAPGSDIKPLPAGDLSATIAPAYGFMPAAVRKEMKWEVTSGVLPGAATSTPNNPGSAAATGGAVAICLRPIASSTPMQRDVLAKLQAQAPVGSTFIGTACNATADVANGAFLTYWIPASHVN